MIPITRRTALQIPLLLMAMPEAMAKIATPAMAKIATLAMAKIATLEWPGRLVDAARLQIGVTTLYDPTYVRLAYPGGDVSQDRGVCTDVVIRAIAAPSGSTCKSWCMRTCWPISRPIQRGGV